MTKKAKPMEEVFVVVPANSTIAHKTLAEAFAQAKDECDISGDEYYVLKVMKSWIVALPEEPEPEITDMDLDGLLL